MVSKTGVGHSCWVSCLTFDLTPMPRLRRRPGPALALTIALALVLSGSSSIAQDAFSEYKVKAAFLFNLPEFVSWPEGALPKDRMTFCIVGHDPFGEALEYFSGKQVKSRLLRIERRLSSDSAEGCSVLFISGQETIEDQHFKPLVSEPAILTVGEADDFTRRGGVVRFIRRGGKVGLEINLTAAHRNRIGLASELLDLATLVRYPAQGGLP